MPDLPALTNGIDREWLEELATRDPILHAYALWDYHYFPDRTQFVTLSRGGRPKCYLLTWISPADIPTSHWISRDTDDELLVSALPPRPLTVVAPERVVKKVLAARGPATLSRVDLMEHHGDSKLLRPTSITVRRLTGADRPLVHRLLEKGPEALREGMQHVDLDTKMLWGALEGQELASIVHASVTLPTAWILNAVYTGEQFRGKGYCKAVVTAATRAGLETGAHVGLYVFADNLPAHRAYERVGFRVIEQKVIIDANDRPRPANTL
jgi:ribosomal protein S18 acetylase RimI-like enzyme